MKVSHHLAKFCGHVYFGSGDLLALVYHVISRDYVAKGWSGIMGRIPSL